MYSWGFQRNPRLKISILAFLVLLGLFRRLSPVSSSGPRKELGEISPGGSYTKFTTAQSCKLASVSPGLPALPPIPGRPVVSSAESWLKNEGARYGGTVAKIPENLLGKFTQDGKIELIENIFDQPYLGGDALSPVWTFDMVEDFRKRAEDRQAIFSYENAPIYEALEARASLIRNKRGIVIGSEKPWAEGTLLAFGAAHITTVEFGNIRSEHPAITAYTPSNFTVRFLEGRIERFDFAFTYSSLEHDGLGRYGDLINPVGDLQTMAKLRDIVAPGGAVFVGMPCCFDRLEFNAHRVYGPLRLPLLFAGYKVLGVHPFSEVGGTHSWTQPVWVLQNMKGCGGVNVRPQLVT